MLLLLTVLSPDPAGTIASLIRGPFANTYTFGNMLATMSILIICGAGMTISFQAGLFNLGGEGQIYSAGLAGAVIGLLLPVQTGIIGTLLIMIIGTAVGALIAGVSGYLLYRFRIHELISSFLLSGALSISSTSSSRTRCAIPTAFFNRPGRSLRRSDSLPSCRHRTLPPPSSSQ